MKIYHPTIKNVSREIPEADSDAWTEQGWRKTDPAKKKNESPANGETNKEKK